MHGWLYAKPEVTSQAERLGLVSCSELGGACHPKYRAHLGIRAGSGADQDACTARQWSVAGVGDFMCRPVCRL